MHGFDSFQLRQRAAFARGLLSLVFVVLITAFFRTQILQHDRYQLRAETNRLRAIPLEPPRGPILDRHGEVIAENLPGFAVKLFAPSRDSLRAVLERFNRVEPLDSADMVDIERRFRSAPYQPVLVLGDASFQVVSELEERRAILPGLIIQSEPKRFYPNGRAVAHLVGYVGEVNESDLEANRYPGAAAGSIVGKSGLERTYDSVVRGEPGIRYVEVNARGRLVRENVGSASLPPVNGKPLVTQIDLPLQHFIDSIWPVGVRGAMIAMTPKGEIRALYSAPSYDPNLFVGGISSREWRVLNTDENKPLLNRAINGGYPPASPFKLATAAMGLKRGLINMKSRMPVPCSGGYQLGNRYFRCWKKEGHGSLDLTGAVAQSCDVYFYQLGLRIGLDHMLEDGVAMGFAGRSGVDLPSEWASFYPGAVDYFNKRYGPRNWSAPAVTLNFAIGQGENTQTLINMVQFYQALAGNGIEVSPFVAEQRDATKHDLGLTPEQLEGLRLALIAVVERGTAAASRQRSVSIAGKTGTAQNSHGKDHGWFLGFAPAESPQLVVGAIMEAAEHGSSVAPYVSQVLARYILGPDSLIATRRPLAVVRDSAPRAIEVTDSGTRMVPPPTPQLQPLPPEPPR